MNSNWLLTRPLTSFCVLCSALWILIPSLSHKSKECIRFIQTYLYATTKYVRSVSFILITISPDHSFVLTTHHQTHSLYYVGLIPAWVGWLKYTQTKGSDVIKKKMFFKCIFYLLYSKLTVIWISGLNSKLSWWIYSLFPYFLQGLDAAFMLGECTANCPCFFGSQIQWFVLLVLKQNNWMLHLGKVMAL